MKRARGPSLSMSHTLLVVACVGCKGADSHGRDGRRNSNSAAAAGRSVAAASKLVVDPWFLAADSMMRRYVAVQQYGDTTPATAFDDCDGGSENDTGLMAVSRIRVIGHGAVDSIISGKYAMRSASFTLELTTAARLVPTWTLAGRLHFDSPDNYIALVGVHVHTVHINLEETTPPRGWSLCDAYRQHVEFTPFWDFITQPATDIGHVAWRPASASWSDVARLADSLAAAPRK